MNFHRTARAVLRHASVIGLSAALSSPLLAAGANNVIDCDRDSYAVLMRIALLSSLGAADSTGNLGCRCARPLDGVPR